MVHSGAVTHGINQTQRPVECAITGTGTGQIETQAPPDGDVIPPGYYLLFVMDGARAPSVGRWIRLTR